MAEHTSTREGLQKALEWSLTGPATDEDVRKFVEATVLPDFYQIKSGQRIEYEEYLKGIVELRGVATDYKPKM